MVSTLNRKINSSYTDLENELKKNISGEVRFDAITRQMYSTDASIYSMEPIGVVLPHSKEDVSNIIKIAYKNNVSILPRGGGTGLSGQTVNHSIVIDFSKYLHNIIEVNPEEKWVKTQPGITIDQLNSQIRNHNLFFTPDPSTTSRANVGGALGNNSCGAHSVVYGKTVDQIIDMEVVLSDGSVADFRELDLEEVIIKSKSNSFEGNIYKNLIEIAKNSSPEVEKRFSKILRRVGGYNLDLIQKTNKLNLSKLMVGSEGTLAAITNAKVKLEEIPKFKALSILHFKDINSAMEATVATLEENPAAVEHIGEMIIRQARESLGFSRNLTFLEGEPSDILVVEMTGNSEKEVEDKLNKLDTRMSKNGKPYAATKLFTKSEQNQVWGMRQAGLGLLMNIPGDAKPAAFVEDTAVSPEKLPEYVKRFDEIVRSNNTEAGYYGHASVGCLHIRPIVNLKDKEGIKTMEKISDEVSDLVLEFGGSLSGEHGDGIVRGAWAEKMFGKDLVNHFREVKSTFDPKGIMNPKKIFDTTPLTENLRYGEEYKTIDMQTKYDWSSDGGFSSAIENCTGVGACRKLKAGSMCPSYQATREEMHSTRGRANVLRSVITGKLPFEKFHSKELFKVLSLCVECKSCKSECPSNVDMAKIKSEFLYNYNKKNGTPLASRIIGNIHLLNSLGSKFSFVTNLIFKSFLFRQINEKVLGFDSRRPLPALSNFTFEKWFKSHKTKSSKSRGKVILFHDTYMNFNHPESGVAATKILENLGYEIEILKRKCCGRPMISKGLLDQAAKNAKYNVDLLYKYVEKGYKIIGCESSCMMTLKDEYPDLLKKSEKSVKVSKNTFMLEEIIAQTTNDGKEQIKWNEKSSNINIQVHCHQKALIGTKATEVALNLPKNFNAKIIDAGCCGMAGSFGFEKKNYDISMKMAEDRLFPALKKSDESDSVVITGVSCKQQIIDGTSRNAKFLSEVLAEAIDD
tara:strand:- start:12358 stop:15264 length:2907 start_codon:yes stop_codon:yes gene_type:complete